MLIYIKIFIKKRKIKSALEILKFNYIIYMNFLKKNTYTWKKLKKKREEKRGKYFEKSILIDEKNWKGGKTRKVH